MPPPFAWFVLAAALTYVAIDVVLVFLRPQFSVLHNAESDYGSRGAWAWLMDAAFLLRGLLSLAALRALMLDPGTSSRRPTFRSGAVLVAVWSVCSALLSLFPDDPLGGRSTASGNVHMVLALVAFLAMFAGAILVSVSLQNGSGSKPVSTVMLVLAWGALLPLLLLEHARLRPDSLGGLWEKVFLAVELLWLVLAALRGGPLRPPPRQGPPP